MTKETAIALGNTEFWTEMTPGDIARFQICEERLCMPFSVFHAAVERTLGRPVFSREFGLNPAGLKAELFKDMKMPDDPDWHIRPIPEAKRKLVSL